MVDSLKIDAVQKSKSFIAEAYTRTVRWEMMKLT
ncbi:MAG: hypothetical protein ACD_28C00034G0004 [uncultured bacterium]|nr:MAG: hypothetical protein ACD_28C00034G0004 [uncultured bacterium]KKT75073.1 MAG: hypothetical protein UW70_C0039G0004 [Candidatus Peregrinibacteria bacterium GW2011_GWA2_44_7]